MGEELRFRGCAVPVFALDLLEDDFAASGVIVVVAVIAVGCAHVCDSFIDARVGEGSGCLVRMPGDGTIWRIFLPRWSGVLLPSSISSAQMGQVRWL